MDSYTERIIIDAVKSQDLKLIIQLLHSKKMHPNFIFPDLGVAAIHLVVGYGTEAIGAQIMYHLLRYGGDPNLPSEDGITPVHVASSWGRSTILHLLLLYGGDPWVQDDEMRNAFYYAEGAKAYPALEMLHNFQLKKATNNRTKKMLTVSPTKNIDILSDTEAEIEIKKNRSTEHVRDDKRLIKKGNKQTETGSISIVNPVPQTKKSFAIPNSANVIGCLPKGLQHLVLDNKCSSKFNNIHITKGTTEIESGNGICTFEKSNAAPDRHSDDNELYEYSCTSRQSILGVGHSPINEIMDSENGANSTFVVDGNGDSMQDAIANCSPRKSSLVPIKYFKSCTILDFPSNTCEQIERGYSSTESSKECNILDLGLIESEADTSKDNTFSSTLEIILNSKGVGEEGRKTYTVKEGKTDLLKSIEENKKTLHSANLCIEKVKLFEKKSKTMQPEKIPKTSSIDLNKTFTLKQSPESRADLFAELSVAVNKRALRLSELDQLNSNEADKPHQKNYNEATINKSASNKLDQKADATTTQVVPEIGTDSDQKTIIILQESPRVQTPGSSEDDLYISCEGDITAERKKCHSEQRDDQLRETLRACGKEIGPVTDTTRAVYQKMLEHIQSTGAHSTPEVLPLQMKVANEGDIAMTLTNSPHVYNFNYQYCPELMAVLQSSARCLPYETLEANITKDFNESWHDWRGGTAKTCFNYLLLDGRVTKNLPSRAVKLSFQEVTRIFIEAIFYIGKGQAGRPYAHLQSAATVWKTKSVPADPKTAHILSIWKAGNGVVCLHVFHNTITAEAHTREAAMIDGLGRTNIRNLRRGEYYGRAARWPQADQRRLGVRLLLKARDILLSEGERAIRPEDISQYPNKTKNDALPTHSKRHDPSHQRSLLNHAV